MPSFVPYPPSSRIALGPLRIDLRRETVEVEGDAGSLTPRAEQLLLLLARYPNLLVTRDQILDTVWAGRVGRRRRILCQPGRAVASAPTRHIKRRKMVGQMHRMRPLIPRLVQRAVREVRLHAGVGPAHHFLAHLMHAFVPLVPAGERELRPFLDIHHEGDRKPRAIGPPRIGRVAAMAHQVAFGNNDYGFDAFHVDEPACSMVTSFSAAVP